MTYSSAGLGEKKIVDQTQTPYSASCNATGAGKHEFGANIRPCDATDQSINASPLDYGTGNGASVVEILY